MAVAKRQSREKPSKIEQRKVRGLEWDPQVKQTALLARPIYIGQAPGGREKTFEKSQNWASGLSSLHFSFKVSLPSCLEGVCSFACQIKFWAVIELWHWSAVSNVCGETERRKLHAPHDICILLLKLLCYECLWFKHNKAQRKIFHGI